MAGQTADTLDTRVGVGHSLQTGEVDDAVITTLAVNQPPAPLPVITQARYVYIRKNDGVSAALAASPPPRSTPRWARRPLRAERRGGPRHHFLSHAQPGPAAGSGLTQGTVTQYGHDSVGHSVSTTQAANTASVRTLNARYDVQGRLVGELSAEGDALANVRTDSGGPALRRAGAKSPNIRAAPYEGQRRGGASPVHDRFTRKNSGVITANRRQEKTPLRNS